MLADIEDISRGKTIFILWHVYECGEEDAKLIGVYSSETKAEAAKARTAKLPGFCGHPDDFLIDKHTVDEDHWKEGFITIPDPQQAQPKQP